ncbi:uncharacterized protein LOC107630017 isoform X8 [Arachis ipaensis]|uniref:uncharacterized protein LOC107630017 isoform X8 n=1 Tax=Arachis ipaensis TaxID=130454 RepID=UPI000A2B3610|nr:uncharacterized protein LOC107630017 isoform X8 [Arachis ipaensis]XP_025643619.1 uncharacterized protein LOC112737761 isoform X6 [Arachis hypogaea]
MPYPVIVDDNDIDDAALWAVIDSAAASHSSSKSKTLPTITYPNQRQSPSPVSKPSPSPVSSLPPGKFHRISRDSGEVVQESWAYRPPRKVARIAAPPEANVSGSPLAMVRTVERTPPTKAYASPESYLSPGIGKLTGQEVSGSCTELSPQCFGGGGRRSEKVDEEKENGMWHGLSGRFPSVSLFKEYQNAAMAESLSLKKQVGERYLATLIFLMKSEIRTLSLMRIAMFSVLSLLFVHTCSMFLFGVADSQMAGALVSDVKRDFRNQIMIFQAQLRPEPKTKLVRYVIFGVYFVYFILFLVHWEQ